MLIGQKRILSIVDKLIVSRKNSIFPHSIFIGPAGYGKTSFIKHIGDRLNRSIININGSTITNINQIIRGALSAQENDILFIDEVHRMGVKCQESLYPIFDDGRIDIFDETSQDPISIKLKSFTVLCATTNIGKLSKPFLSRFEHIFELDKYSIEDISSIIKNESSIDIDAENLASYSRGIPRLAISLTRWINDYCMATHQKIATGNIIKTALAEKGISEFGLTVNDRRYLNLLSENIGRPIGLSTISSCLNLDIKTIEDYIEPFLLEQKMVFKTKKGRVISPRIYNG